MAITVHLDEMLKRRGGTGRGRCAQGGNTGGDPPLPPPREGRGGRFHTINKICYYLDCGVGDILRFDGRLEDEDEKN